MQNGPKTTMTSAHRPKAARPFAIRSKQGPSNGDRADFRGSQNAQRSYERYLALAHAEAQLGNTIAAESYYQHAEHYFRSMRSNLEET